MPTLPGESVLQSTAEADEASSDESDSSSTMEEDLSTLLPKAVQSVQFIESPQLHDGRCGSRLWVPGWLASPPQWILLMLVMR